MTFLPSHGIGCGKHAPPPPQLNNRAGHPERFQYQNSHRKRKPARKSEVECLGTSPTSSQATSRAHVSEGPHGARGCPAFGPSRLRVSAAPRTRGKTECLGASPTSSQTAGRTQVSERDSGECRWRESPTKRTKGYARRAWSASCAARIPRSVGQLRLPR